MKAIDYFETAKQIVREDAIKKGYTMKKPRKTWDFTTVVYIFVPAPYPARGEGEEYEIEIGISYDAVYEPEFISGPPENCYPDSSEMTLTEMVILDDLPEGVTEDMVRYAAEVANERIQDEAWEDFENKRYNHD